MRSKSLSVSRRRFSPAERVGLLARYHRSQLTQREFVEQHDVSLATLTKWLRLERQSAKIPLRKSPPFAELSLAGQGWLGGRGGAARWLDRATDARRTRHFGGTAAAPMLNFPPAVRVFVALAPVDLRGSFNRHCALARDQLSQDPLSGHLFVFTNRPRNHVS